MTYFRLLSVFLRIAVLNELQYRVNFYVQMLRSLLALGTGLAAIGVVFSHTDRLAGWREDELLALLGVYFLVGGAIRLVIQPSMQKFMEDVRQGTLDFTLTKPEDAQVLVSVGQVQVWKLVDFLLGFAILGVALNRLHTRIGPTEVGGFALAMLAGGLIVYAFWLILATLSFWFVRIENIMVIFLSMYEAGRWPIGIYPWWLRTTLTFIVPIAFATSVPAEAISGRMTLQTLLGGLALAVVLLGVSRWFWRVGLRQYSGASA